MSSPLYFFPKVHLDQLATNGRPNRKVLADRGLLESLGDLVNIHDQCSLNDIMSKGPGDMSGAMLVVNPPAKGNKLQARIGYYPAIQDWFHVVGQGDADSPQLWIGVDKEDPVGASDLQRTRGQLSGYELTIDSPDPWIVPVIRRPDSSTDLPSSMGWDASGSYAETIKPAYRQIWEDMAEVVEWFSGAGFSRAHRGKALDMALRGLGLHYRLGRHEQQVLGVVDTANYVTILKLMIDWPLVMSLLEKKSNQESSEPPSTNT